MGLFSKSAPAPKSAKLYECKLCGKEVPEDRILPSLGICDICGTEALSFAEDYLTPSVQRFQGLANKTADPDEKLLYLKALLDVMYEYKVKYQDQDVKLVQDDINDDIATIIQAISRIRM